MNRDNHKFFTKKAYDFYPKGIDFYLDQEDYKNSKEHIHLLQKISSEKDKIDIKSFFENVKLEEGLLIRDYSMIELGDRCLNFQVVKKNEKFFISLCFNISLLIPFYCTYFLTTFLDKEGIGWKDSPKIFNPKHNDSLNTILKTAGNKLESPFNYKKFPFLISSNIIPDLSYYDIRHNNHTYFNAFFLDSYYTRL